VILPDLKESQTSFGAFAGGKSRLPVQKSPQSIVRLERRANAHGFGKGHAKFFPRRKEKIMYNVPPK